MNESIDSLIDALHDQSVAIKSLQQSLAEWQEFLEQAYQDLMAELTS